MSAKDNLKQLRTPAQLSKFKNPALRVTQVDYAAQPQKAAKTDEPAPPRKPAPPGESAPPREPAPASEDSNSKAQIALELAAVNNRQGEENKAAKAALANQENPDAKLVLSLNPEDARPFTPPLKIDENLLRTNSPATYARISEELIILTVADPDEVWSADLGASDHFLREDWVVQVRRSDNSAIGVFEKPYALAVRPEYESEMVQDLSKDAQTGVKKQRRKLGSRHPASVQELKERLKEFGFEIKTGSTHGKVTHPNFPGLFIPWASTPSDRRHPMIVSAQIKRIFGIDIRKF